MTSMPATVQRFTHTHLLTKSANVGDYICDGCGTYGSGKTYRCKPCNYDLHEFCATCPLSLPAVSIHPQHELSLYKRKQQSTSQDARVCDICNESFEGLYYRCEICDFDAHPYCTQFPQNVNHAIHSAHTLKFCFAEASECNVCHDSCQSWRYRCELCNYDIHVKCIMDVTTLLARKNHGVLREEISPRGRNGMLRDWRKSLMYSRYVAMYWILLVKCFEASPKNVIRAGSDYNL